MRINIIAVGTKMPSWVREGVTQYTRRFPRELSVAWQEIPLARRDRDNNPELFRKLEGEKILKVVPAGNTVIALEVTGRQWTTGQLAGELSKWQLSGNDVSLLIGGPDGLSQAVTKRANQQWSLSPLTLPHPLVRVLLAEQLYRAWTINSGHPYHRD